MTSSLSKIGVLTSGGDAPGMNACIRAVVRTACYYGIETVGIRRGYEGMIDGDFVPLPPTAVSNIIHLGGTILKTARSARFKTQDGLTQAYQNLMNHQINAVVVIGGDGTYRGAKDFINLYPEIKMIGCPGTIDNDLNGTDFTIGYDTAINTAMQAIDRIRDTAAATNRLFFIEVMGRDSGFIALRTGLASGAEAILVPETKTDIDAVCSMLEAGWRRQKSSFIIVVAEGDDAGGAFEVAARVKARFNQYETKVSILGHIQRGGSPTCMDRVLAARVGAAAVEALIAQKSGLAAGLIHDQVQLIPFEQATKQNIELNPNLLKLVDILST